MTPPPGSTEAYYPRLYEELRALARARVRDGGGLEPTELVNEAYLKLRGHNWANTEHFRATAARAMRQVLVDQARSQARLKRLDPKAKMTFDEELEGVSPRQADILQVDRALSALAKDRPRAAQVAELRVFGGLTALEIAQVLKVSDRTVKSDWRLARAFLAVHLG